MTSSWQLLAGNLAVVALVVLGWGHARFWLRGVNGEARSALFGLAMGTGAIASMVMGAEVSDGVHLDLRLTLIAVAAFFGGPLAAFITTVLATAWRVEMGGEGMLIGVYMMGLTTLVGLLGRMLTTRRGTSLKHGLVLAVAVMGTSASVLISVPTLYLAPTFLNFVLPLGVLNFVATWLASLVFLQARRFAAERDLLAAALNQAPDFAYVKDGNSRFAAANLAVARLHGFRSPLDMIGKTDFDLTTRERAEMLFEQEQEAVSTGKPLLDFVEQLADQNGELRWYTTAKVPLHNSNGEMIGLAGVTRDITEEKKLRQDLIDSRNTLSYALAEMSDGLAMFDENGQIVLCNEQYRASFPYTSQARREGAYLRDVLRMVVQTGEQLNVPSDDPDGWIDRIVANLQVESEEEVAIFDGRWLQVRTRPTAEGKTMVVVTDITRLKQAELALQSATDQLKQLVRTDGLTGLLNRRAFDDAMETEIARSARAATPMSVLLIDVDNFKAYNDRYGHPAGDQCLRLLSEHLKAALKRPADMAARYGGEEFAAILPDTDEDGAYQVAEAFRRSLAAARIPHAASDRGYLTASVGVATYMPDNLHRSTTELVQVADEALYSAKAAGRDRVYGTRVTGQQRRYANK